MAGSFDGSNQRARWPNPYNATANPITMAFWVKPDSVAQNQYFMNLERSDNGFGILWWTGAAASPAYQTSRRFSTTSKTKGSVSALSTGSWQHCLSTDSAASTSADTIEQFVGGTLLGTSSASNGGGTESTFTGQLVLAGRTADTTRQYDGLLAEVAMWNRVLIASERNDLAGGKAPSFITSGLVFYAPLTESVGWTDEVSEVTGTLDNSPTLVSDHPTIEYPAGPGGPGRGLLLANQRNRLVRGL